VAARERRALTIAVTANKLLRMVENFAARLLLISLTFSAVMRRAR
jgi:hypothetical protein